MQRITCSNCRAILEYSTQPPRFCSQCGRAVEIPVSNDGDAAVATVAFTPQPATRPDVSPAIWPENVPSSAPPSSVGGYRLLRALGSGGMGTVYEAEQEGTGQRVAVKLIRQEFADSDDAVERFRREGRLASTITHPRCVFVLAADEEQGRPYIVMELMPGQNLMDLVEKEGPLSVEKAVGLILDIIEGLQEAHYRGVVHRDVKPSNCFLDAQGRVKVGDFGLAKSLLKDQHLTHTGAFLGTILYAAPEQIRMTSVDSRADIYSVGATLYYLLTGRAPFQTDDAAATLARTMTDPLPSLRGHRPELPRLLDEVIARAMQRNREQRYQSLEELRLALLPFVPGDHSIAEVGYRFGAILVDGLILWPLMFICMAVVILGVDLLLGTLSDITVGLLAQITGLVVGLLYFGGLETVWGATPGKLFFRLRVSDAVAYDRPRWTQAFLRTFIFYLFKDFGPLVVHALVQPLNELVTGEMMRINSGLVLASIFAVWILPTLVSVAGLLLTAVTMRRRNGYRGIHELASGTRTIRLPLVRARRKLPLVDHVVAAPTGAPQGKMGAFQVRQALSWQGERGLLLAEDSGLGRQVWIWLHGEGSSFTTPARREVGRSTRPRWVGQGQRDGQAWDAFVAAPGCPLTTLVRPGRRLLWADFLPILEQLTEELCEATRDGTLPRVLTPEQIWLEPNGRVQLLDAPPTPQLGGDTTDDAERALRLLREACRLALEGNTSATAATQHLAAPLPGYASALMNRLFGVAEPYTHPDELRCELEAVKERPTEVSRPRRGLHLFVQSLLLFVGLAVMYLSVPLLVQGQFWERFVAGALGEAALRQHQSIAPESLPRQVIESNTANPNKLLDEIRMSRALLELQLTKGEREAELVLASCSNWARTLVGKLRKDVSENLERTRLKRASDGTPNLETLVDVSQEATRSLRDSELLTGTESRINWHLPLAVITFWPVVWALWALLTRGGLLRWLVGIRLVQADGHPARRFRCLWRAIVIWLPVVLLLLLSAYADLYRIWHAHENPDLGRWLTWVAWGSWWLAVLLLPIYAWFARQNPARSLHDRLAGTYQVPA